MPADPPDLDPQQLWQSQPREHPPMTVADIHANAGKFERRVRLGNTIEYVACAVVVLAFGRMALTGSNGLLPGPALFAGDVLVRLGAGLIVAGTLYAAWQLRRRASVVAPLEGADSLVDAYKVALARRRDALRSILSWYLLPFVPGLSVMLAGIWLRKPPANLPASAARYVAHVIHYTTLTVAIICAMTFVIIWLLNQRAADRLQRQIDEL
jgi:hypothetical protein